MTGAIEFLRKAKAIEDSDNKAEIVGMIIRCIWGVGKTTQADLVRKVMAYQLKEDKDAEGN